MAALPVVGRRLPRNASRGAAFAVALAGLSGLLVVAVVSMLWPAVGDRSDVVVRYDAGGPVAQPFHAFDIDGWLVRQADGRVRAFSAAEARTACRVRFIAPPDRGFARSEAEFRGEPGFFRDECWNSRWTLSGVVTGGASWRGLDEFEVKGVSAGRVSLDVSRVRLGACAKGAESLRCSRPGHLRYMRPQIVRSGVFW